MKKQNVTLVIIAVVMVVAAALARVFFYPLSFAPQIAMALFAGAVIENKKVAFALPLFAMLLADILFEVFNITQGFWGWGQLVGYGILALITVIGFNLKKISVGNVIGFSLLSSVVFYLLSNSAVWLLQGNDYHAYAYSFSGYINCLAAGLPFLEKGLLVDLGYSAVLFGGYVALRHFAVHDNKVIA